MLSVASTIAPFTQSVLLEGTESSNEKLLVHLRLLVLAESQQHSGREADGPQNSREVNLAAYHLM